LAVVVITFRYLLHRGFQPTTCIPWLNSNVLVSLPAASISLLSAQLLIPTACDIAISRRHRELLGGLRDNAPDQPLHIPSGAQNKSPTRVAFVDFDTESWYELAIGQSSVKWHSSASQSRRTSQKVIDWLMSIRVISKKHKPRSSLSHPFTNARALAKDRLGDESIFFALVASLGG
jgi:hypothetical protein